MIDALFVQYINFPHGIENNKKIQPPHTHLWDTLTVDVMNFSNIQKKAYISKMPEEHLKSLIKTPERVSYHIHGAAKRKQLRAYEILLITQSTNY
jgi:hypothetical protein